MLTRDRPEMAKRAVASFRAQTYGNKLLLIYDTSTVEISDNFPEDWYEDDLIQLQFQKRLFRQDQMAYMYRIKCSAQYSYTHYISSTF